MEPSTAIVENKVEENNGKSSACAPECDRTTDYEMISDDPDDFEEEPEPEAEPDSLADMLNNREDDDYYGYDDAY